MAVHEAKDSRALHRATHLYTRYICAVRYNVSFKMPGNCSDWDTEYDSTRLLLSNTHVDFGHYYRVSPPKHSFLDFLVHSYICLILEVITSACGKYGSR